MSDGLAHSLLSAHPAGLAMSATPTCSPRARVSLTVINTRLNKGRRRL